jgi:hypothetical protein
MFQGVERPYELIFCNQSIEKSDLFEVLWMFQVLEWHWEHIICLLNVLKYDCGDFEEAMFHDVVRPFESIFYILGIQKSDLDEVAEVLFHIGEWTWELITCISGVLKNDFGEVDKRCFKVFQGHTNSFSAFWASKKATCLKSLKCCFNYPNGPEKSKYSSWTS